jgi:uncharacterized protein (TIGR02145 family)
MIANKNKIMRSLIIGSCLLSLVTSASYSQKVTNIRFQYSGKQIVIFYDLSGPEGSAWIVNIYLSENEGETWSKALKQVTGDVGNSIIPGIQKKAYWDRFAENKSIDKQFKFLVIARADNFSHGESGAFTDTRDGKDYKWIRIGKQVWMAQNLNIGLQIDGIKMQSNNGNTEKYCYNDLELNCNTYGGLYQWDEIMQYSKKEGTQGICPENWHIPADAEWTFLIEELGGKKTSYESTKELGNVHWKIVTKGITNKSGLTVLPGGLRNEDTSSNVFNNMRNEAYFWSSTEHDAKSAYAIGLGSLFLETYKYSGTKSNGFSVRCIHD